MTGAPVEKWLLATFRPVTLFSLRMSAATSSAAKTLLVPTPYAFKLALVDAAFRADGERLARRVLDCVKGVDVRFRPPKHAVVTHTFVKVKRQPKQPNPEEPYISSISYREFCFYQGDLEVALGARDFDREQIGDIVVVLRHINYLGKRGSFFQYLGFSETGELPAGFTVPMPGEVQDIAGYGVTQFLDELVDAGDENLFDRINTYSEKPIGKHRILKPYLLPYRFVRSSKRYTHYVGPG